MVVVTVVPMAMALARWMVMVMVMAAMTMSTVRAMLMVVVVAMVLVMVMVMVMMAMLMMMLMNCQRAHRASEQLKGFNRKQNSQTQLSPRPIPARNDAPPRLPNFPCAQLCRSNPRKLHQTMALPGCKARPRQKTLRSNEKDLAPRTLSVRNWHPWMPPPILHQSSRCLPLRHCSRRKPLRFPRR